MKWLLVGIGAIIVLVGLLAIYGALLPRTHVASSSIVLKQPPDSVWPVIRDLGALPSWWRDVKRSVRLPDEGGKERWEQQTGMGPMSLEIAESLPPVRLVTRIIPRPGAADFGGTWTYEIAVAGGGSRITITEEGWVANPLFRFMSYKVFGLYGTMDGCLKALGSRFGESVQPAHGQ